MFVIHCSYMFKYVEQVTLSSKILLMRSLVTTIFLYNCESWTFTAELQSHGNEVLPQDTTHLIQRPFTEDVCAKIQRAIGPHEDLLTIVKRCKLQWYGHVSCHQVWPKPSCKEAQWKGEEDEADRGRGGKTTSGNGQAWSSLSPRGQWRTGENGGN